jgi:hypothetical protein
MLIEQTGLVQSFLSHCGKVFSSFAFPQRLMPNQLERFFGTAEAVP